MENDPHWAFIEIRDPTCSLCNLGNLNGDLRCLTGVGPRDANFMFIGEAPGRREIEPDIRRPFAGPAGQYLDKILENINLDRESTYITNVIACKPPHNDEPTPAQVTACRNILWAQISTVKPKKIMALGNVALKALVGRSGIATYRGQKFSLQVTPDHSAEVYVSYHPSAVRRNPRLYPLLYTDLLKFKGSNTVPIELDYQPITDMPTFRNYIRVLLQSPEVSFDFETESLDPWTGARIICIGLSHKEGHARVIPLEGKAASWTDKELDEIYRLLGSVLSHPRINIIAFNSKFETLWCKTRGISVRVDSDPMMTSVLLDENLPHSLEANIQLYLDPDFTKPEPKDISSWSWKKVWPYNAGDADWTLRLHHKLLQKIENEPSSKVLLEELIMPVQTKVLPKLELNGIYVHEDKLDEAGKKCQEEAVKWEVEIRRYVPPDYIPPVKSKKSLKKGFNPGSPKQLGNLLFDVLGLPPGPLTTGGDWSTAEAVLQDLKGQHLIMESILEFRKYSKYLSTYILPWRGWMDSNGFIHPHYHLRPVTGRTSSDDPNIQQTPREEFMRGCLGAPPFWLGYAWWLLAADYSQIEMRMAAHLSKDENLLAVFNNGEDVHLMTAMLVTGLPADNITKELRKKAKAVNFGLIYGMGAFGLMKYAKEKFEVEMTLDEATYWRQGFFRRYPRLLEWHRRQIKEVRDTQRVVSMIGRVRHLNNILSSDREVAAEAERQAINSPDQGLASDITLLSAVEVDKILLPTEGWLAGLVHDESLYIIREDRVDYWKDKIKNTMENPPLHRFTSEKLLVPLEVDIKVSTYWG